MTETCIHIGLPKAASTYLQHNLSKVEDTAICPYSALHELRLAAMGEYDPDQAVDLFEKRLRLCRGVTNFCMISDERLSSWRHVDFRFLAREQVRQYQLSCAQLLRRAVGNAKVLLLARNPRAWLRSLYAQYVKAGETRSFLAFCARNRDYLIQASKLDDLAEIYSAEFGSDNVSIFPIEAMDLNESDDWRYWLTQNFGFQSSWERIVHYRSLDAGATEAVRYYYRIVETLARTSGMSESKLQQVKAQMFAFIESTLVDQAENQKRLRRLFGDAGDLSLPPESLISAMLAGMKKTIQEPRFARVESIYTSGPRQ